MTIHYGSGAISQPPQVRVGSKKKRKPLLSETCPSPSPDPLSFFEIHLCSVFMTNMRGDTPFMRQRPNLNADQMAALKRAIGWDLPTPEDLTQEEWSFARRCTGPFLIAEMDAPRDVLEALAAKHWIQFRRYYIEEKEQYPPQDLRLPWFCIVPTPKGWRRILETLSQEDL